MSAAGNAVYLAVFLISVSCRREEQYGPPWNGHLSETNPHPSRDAVGVVGEENTEPLGGALKAQWKNGGGRDPVGKV